jgi:hypothetical protein
MWQTSFYQWEIRREKTIIGGTEYPKYHLNNSLIEKMNNLESFWSY